MVFLAEMPAFTGRPIASDHLAGGDRFFLLFLEGSVVAELVQPLTIPICGEVCG